MRNPFKIPRPVTATWYRRVYLKTAFWKFRRDRYLQTANYRCENRPCSRAAVIVQHTSYANLFCERDPDLMALCEQCHQWMNPPPAANDNDPQMRLPLFRPPG